jgi:hypothetical protein
MKTRLLLLGVALASAPVTRADIARTFNAVPFTFSGYVDAYYVDDGADTPFPDRQITPSGVSPDYSHTRKDKIAVNHALLDAKFATDSVRGALGVQAGTYVQKNYAIEDSVALHLFEAQLGFKPVASTPLWIDAGIFASHIGLESALSKDNLTPTRSLMADNTPYYEAGAKLTWDPNARWEYTLCLLQGWQQIGSKNSNKALGTQIQFKPADGLVLNSSTYLGQSPNSRARLRRYFHDFYVTWQATKACSLAFTTDAGADERSVRDRSLVGWVSATALAKWQFAPQWAVAGRVEAYRDPHGVTIATGTPDNFVATGGSLNLDYQPDPHVLLRIEARTLATAHAVFVERSGLSDSNSYLTVSTALSF